MLELRIITCYIYREIMKEKKDRKKKVKSFAFIIFSINTDRVNKYKIDIIDFFLISIVKCCIAIRYQDNIVGYRRKFLRHITDLLYITC